ncbi:MAG: hypothetical protein HN576_07860 [Bacteriovoracaceae bacterium]|jgi:transcription elongation GreA/GreB family factor|nr:hypothetical protein [Bacteriovoracaceae bacterium]
MDFELKIEFIDKIRNQLKTDLETLQKIAEKEKSFATSKEMQAEGKYDTRKVEASYLAGAQARRVEELKQNYLKLKNFSCKDHSKNLEITVGSLIECFKEDDINSSKCYYFISPGIGGLSFELNNKKIQIVSRFSPIGKALLASHVEDEFELKIKSLKVCLVIKKQV